MESRKRKHGETLPELEPRTYELQRILGQGSFGIVYQAATVELGDVCAIKSIRPVRLGEDGKAVYTRDGPDREVQILKELNGHPNIVFLKGAFFTNGDSPEKCNMNLVLEFLSDTLHRVIKHHNKLGKNMDLGYIRLYFYHLMRGLVYMHGRGIAHCDLKPQNLLLDGKSHVLKICDFGTAKRLVLGEKRGFYVCSRYFRAPEIILGSQCYGTPIDLWSAGCIFAEMIVGQPLFTGRDGIDQLVEIIKVIGTPSRYDLWAMNPNYPNYDFHPAVYALPWENVLKNRGSQDACDVIGGLVKYDPFQRFTPVKVLLHSYFEPLRAQARPENHHLFQFLPEELLWCTRAEAIQLQPHWARAKDMR